MKTVTSFILDSAMDGSNFELGLSLFDHSNFYSSCDRKEAVDI